MLIANFFPETPAKKVKFAKVDKFGGIMYLPSNGKILIVKFKLFFLTEISRSFQMPSFNFTCYINILRKTKYIMSKKHF